MVEQSGEIDLDVSLFAQQFPDKPSFTYCIFRVKKIDTFLFKEKCPSLCFSFLVGKVIRLAEGYCVKV